MTYTGLNLVCTFRLAITITVQTTVLTKPLVYKGVRVRQARTPNEEQDRANTSTNGRGSLSESICNMPPYSVKDQCCCWCHTTFTKQFFSGLWCHVAIPVKTTGNSPSSAMYFHHCNTNQCMLLPFWIANVTHSSCLVASLLSLVFVCWKFLKTKRLFFVSS